MQLIDPLLEEAFQHFQRGDLAAAEAKLIMIPDQSSALHLLGVLRVRQQRLPEAAELLARSVAIQPRESQSQFNLGKVLVALGRQAEAVETLRVALALDSTLIDAALVLGKALHGLGRFNEAAEAYRKFLTCRPDHAPARLALGEALIAAGRSQEAEPLLSGALRETTDPRLSAELHQALAFVHRRLQPARALEHLERARDLDPMRGGLESDRAALFEELHRFEDARAAYTQILAREPVNAKAHHAYNELLYRLGDEGEFLASYDRAPRTQELMLAKALFLLNAGRHEEAERCYRDTVARYSENKEAALGVGLALVSSGRYADAIAALAAAARLYPYSAEVYCNLAGALAQSGDSQKAGAIAARALEIEPDNQIALAMLGTSWRLMGDGRDETLNGYDEFIQVFDLEPPDGFSDMTSFNAELCAYLETMHPPAREYLRQSLRGGTQTGGNLFGAGHVLVDKLQVRIGEAVGRYVAALNRDERHPYLSRKKSGFRFSGSWSSRLRDCGFHINHLHPGGWISSCYYVDLPEVVKDEAGRQGWIKFGEPSFDVGLSVRRAIQPAAGRLVLFPSYMWHGTVPFHDSHARTTIAFDVIPI
jgi:tetratricopeptide (TPR) repeat protein